METVGLRQELAVKTADLAEKSETVERAGTAYESARQSLIGVLNAGGKKHREFQAAGVKEDAWVGALLKGGVIRKPTKAVAEAARQFQTTKQTFLTVKQAHDALVAEIPVLWAKLRKAEAKCDIPIEDGTKYEELVFDIEFAKGQLKAALGAMGGFAGLVAALAVGGIAVGGVTYLGVSGHLSTGANFVWNLAKSKL